VERAARRKLCDIRVARAHTFMRENYLYPAEVSAILGDYRYSISVTHRGILQVLNIEEAIKAVVAKKLSGAFVETGTFTGGASAYALRSLMRNEPGISRPYWGFDSFEGMPQPTVEDGDYAAQWIYGKRLVEVTPSQVAGNLTGSKVNLAQYDACLAHLHGTGYTKDDIHLVKGWFQDTLPSRVQAIGPIVILRMDGDFYESTKSVLEALYDSVVPGGFVLIDDYGGFEGCRRAVDEFLAVRNVSPHIHYVDHSIHFFMKPAVSMRQQATKDGAIFTEDDKRPSGGAKG
jgi:hypothetical protein